MTDAIAVSERGLVELQVLAVRRQRATASRSSRAARPRGCITSPRFVAKDGDGERHRREGVGRRASRSATRARSITWSGSCASGLPSIGSSASVTASCTAGSSTRSRCASTRTVVDALEKYVPLAPLHQPHNLAPIRLLLERRPELPQVACFDTAFHRGAAARSRRRSRCRKSITERGVLRYGFHGLSYEYIAQVLPQYDARAAAGKVVVLHLGNGVEHVRDRGRPQRREHDGIHRRRRAADGHALRQPRSRASCCT